MIDTPGEAFEKIFQKAKEEIWTKGGSQNVRLRMLWVRAWKEGKRSTLQEFK